MSEALELVKWIGVTFLILMVIYIIGVYYDRLMNKLWPPKK